MSVEMIGVIPIFSEDSFSQTFRVDQKIKEISEIFYDRVVYPVSIGALVETADFLVTTSVLTVFSALGFLEFVEEMGKEALDPTEVAISALLDSSWLENIIGPSFKEVIFKAVIQGSIRWVFTKILPDQEVDVLGYIKLSSSALISIVATSVLFGMAHYLDGGIALVVVCTLNGFAFGVLKEKVGFFSGFAAHAVTNSLVDVVKKGS